MSHNTFGGETDVDTALRNDIKVSSVKLQKFHLHKAKGVHKQKLVFLDIRTQE